MALITNTPRTTLEREEERSLPKTGTACSTYGHPSLEVTKQNEQQQQKHRNFTMSWKHPVSKISTSLGCRGSSEDKVLVKQAWGTEFYPQIPEAGVGGDTSYDSRAVEAERHIDHWAYWTANLWLTNPRLQWETLERDERKCRALMRKYVRCWLYPQYTHAPRWIYSHIHTGHTERQKLIITHHCKWKQLSPWNRKRYH